MYPLGRLFVALIRARRASEQKFEAVCETRFRCWPWDLDVFLEMNNGRQLTLYDLGRMDFSIKTGFARELKKHRWGLVVAGSTTRYRKRIRGFDPVVMYTRWVGCDDRWFYMEQSMWVKGQPASSVLLRTAVTSKGQMVPVETVLAAVGHAGRGIENSEWAQRWTESEVVRPWPPIGG